MNGRFSIGDTVLGNWKLTRHIGEGSYGRVYEARREDFGITYSTAVKIITVPKSEAELKAIYAEGMDEESVTAYFRSFVEEIVSEFALMSSLKGTANIVSYEDHTVIRHTTGIGWDIIIRMELLTPLLDHSRQNTYTRQTIIKLGMDMCRALELCQKFNIVHRDIKPENIFVSELGDFKLGDFGIARTIDKTVSGLSKKGTYSYMAPEVYREEAYGSAVDMYSLGIVLYRMLNDNRTPFLPPYPIPIAYNDQEEARAKRISGAKIPAPKNADGRLAEIVLKACAYDPRERHSSPMQMRQELETIMYTKEEARIIYPRGKDETPIKSIDYAEVYTPVRAWQAPNGYNGKVGSVLGGSAHKHEEQSEPNGTVNIFGTVTSPDYNRAIVGKSAETTAENGRRGHEGTSSVKAPTEPPSETPLQEIRKKSKTPIIIVSCIVAVALIIAGIFQINGLTKTPSNAKSVTTMSAISGIDNFIEMQTGQTLQLNPQIDQKNATSSRLSYESEDTLIAVVNASGEITAISVGKTRIRISVGKDETTIDLLVKPAEEWKNEGYEIKPPYKEYERLYLDGEASDSIRYTGNIKTFDIAVLETSDWVRLNLYWSDGGKTVYEREPENDLWTILRTSGARAIVEPIFTFNEDEFFIDSPMARERYSFFADNTGSYGSDTLKWDFETDPTHSTGNTSKIDQTLGLREAIIDGCLIYIKIIWGDGEKTYFSTMSDGTWGFKDREKPNMYIEPSIRTGMRIPGGNCLFINIPGDSEDDEYVFFESGAGDQSKVAFEWSFSYLKTQ